MNIGALWFGTPWTKPHGDCSWNLAWHPRLDVTWRWSLSVDCFWRKEGYNGTRPDHVRKWKWSYLKPGAYQNVFYKPPSWGGKWMFSPSGSFGWHWLGISVCYSYQPKWDRSFDPEAARRADREDSFRSDMRKAIQERASQQRLQ